jgi:hypothetical protein
MLLFSYNVIFNLLKYFNVNAQLDFNKIIFIWKTVWTNKQDYKSKLLESANIFQKQIYFKVIMFSWIFLMLWKFNQIKILNVNVYIFEKKNILLQYLFTSISEKTYI